ncbi:MAG: Asp-tRNA(Asn)/Glu-tRNA(Gln) amidotransferase subunit GatC [Gemmatimonadales bacterium]|jgi:aspartyl/glutamyl-tRNA(Asn/Gln) amidotransferase C subunit
MAVTRGDILHIAALAELAVDDVTAAELERQLSRILDYVRQLEALDTGMAAPADERAVRLRPDAVGADPLHRPPQEFGAAMQQGLFVVPRLGALGGDEEAQ